MSPGEEMDENTIEALQEVLQDMAKTIELISSGARSGEALISFLEEMLKTIEAWAAKYNVTLDGKTMAMEPTGNPDSYSNPDASPSPSPSPNANHDRNLNPYDNANPYPYTYLDPKPEPNPDPNLANANASQMMDQLELALDLDQDVNVNVNELMDLANERLGENQREGEALPQSAHSLNEEADGLPSNDRKERGNQNETAQLQLGEERQGPSPQTEQGISFPDNRADTASQPSELPMVESSKHVRTTELQDCGLDVVHLVAAGATPSNPHVDHSPMDVNMASTDNADVKMASPNHVPKSLKLEVATPVNDKVVASHASERRGEVIESPAWLPEGWITEMKTRGNGSKAGSKDKYYFDPASKCRCQSRREVFAFLESGKHDRCKGRTKSEPMRKVDGIEDQSAGQANDAGQAKNKRNRYKGRPKTESVRKLVGTEDRSAGQAKDAGQAKSTPETSGIAVSSKLEQQTVPIPPSNNKTSGPPTVPTIAASTGLANSSMLMPHQPGQPSEWLVYESLASLPFPMFEHLRFVENTNKGNSNSSPPSPWPWLFGTSEGLKRPFVDNKPEDSKPVEKSKEGKNVPVTSAGEEAQAAEVVPKRPKKVARKNAS